MTRKAPKKVVFPRSPEGMGREACRNAVPKDSNPFNGGAQGFGHDKRNAWFRGYQREWLVMQKEINATRKESRNHE